MYYNTRKLAVSIMWVLIGIALMVLSLTEVLDDSIYSGMGGALIAVGVIQIIRNVKYHTNDEYKEKIDIAAEDERNSYIRMKAWSWAGYIFILAAAIVSLVLFVMNMTVYGQIVSYCLCSVLVIYWVAYLILQKKY